MGSMLLLPAVCRGCGGEGALAAHKPGPPGDRPPTLASLPGAAPLAAAGKAHLGDGLGGNGGPEFDGTPATPQEDIEDEGVVADLQAQVKELVAQVGWAAVRAGQTAACVQGRGGARGIGECVAACCIRLVQAEPPLPARGKDWHA